MPNHLISLCKKLWNWLSVQFKWTGLYVAAHMLLTLAVTSQVKLHHHHRQVMLDTAVCLTP